jgi:uncharacterized membrane-anchored protein
MRELALVFALVASIVAGSSASAKVPKTDAERKAALEALTWRDGELLQLPKSGGTLQAPQPIRQLLGADAVTLFEAANGTEAPADLEAALFDKQSKAILYYEKKGRGFVHLNDWDDVDADAMLRSLSEAAEADNRQRKEAGIAGIHVVGWLERPHLDRSTSTVRWAWELNDDDSGPVINAVALVLGRDGYEMLTSAVSKTALGDGLLNTGVRSFSFPAGGRHSDFKEGDKVAEYGVAGLVAAILGAKVAGKVGLFAALAVFLKQFGVFVVAGVGAALAWIWRARSRSKQPPPPPTGPPATA